MNLENLSDQELINLYKLENGNVIKYNSLQLAKKISINAFYGSIANEYCRWFSIVMSEAITSTGQLSIQWVARDINKYVNKILGTQDVRYVKYIDTDSCYVDLSGIVNKFFPGKSLVETANVLNEVCENKLQQVINKSFLNLADYINAYDREILVMKRESICSAAVWTAMKKYVLAVIDEEGIIHQEPKIKVTGLEAVKSSTPGVAKKALKRALEIILTSNEEALHTFVEDFNDKFNKMSFMEIAFPRGVSDIDKWVDPVTRWKSGTPIHVKGSIAYNIAIEKFGVSSKYPSIYNGDKVRFAYLTNNNPLNTNVISVPGELPPELKLDAYIDRETQFEKTFIDPLKQATSVIGWEAQKINTLENFFG